MALSKIQAESMNLADTYAFSGTVSGADKINFSSVVATTSGTSADFTSIPTGVKRIILSLRGVSVNSNDHSMVQLGVGGTLKTSGYISLSHYGGAGTSSTSGLVIFQGAIQSGHMILQTMGNNVWIENHAFKYNTNNGVFGGGEVALDGVLDTLRLRPTGSNTYDAGSCSISFEY